MRWPWSTSPSPKPPNVDRKQLYRQAWLAVEQMDPIALAVVFEIAGRAGWAADMALNARGSLGEGLMQHALRQLATTAEGRESQRALETMRLLLQYPVDWYRRNDRGQSAAYTLCDRLTLRDPILTEFIRALRDEVKNPPHVAPVATQVQQAVLNEMLPVPSAPAPSRKPRI